MGQAPPVMKYQMSSAMISESSFICQLRENNSGIFMVQACGGGVFVFGGGAGSARGVLRSRVLSALER